MIRVIFLMAIGTAAGCKRYSTETCLPQTCLQLRQTCGQVSDGCGHALDCGSCTTPQLLANGLDEVDTLAIGHDLLFFGTRNPDGGNGSLISLRKDGSGQLVTLASSESFQDLALDDDFAYWTDWTARSIKRVPLDGGAVQILASGQGLPDRIQVQGGHAYWTTFATDQVMKAPLDGGASAVIAARGSPAGASGLQVDEGGFYCLYDDGSIFHGPTADGGQTQVATATGSGGTGLTMDATSLYWSMLNDAKIFRVSKDGGTPEVIVVGLQAGFLAVDSRNLYAAGPNSIRGIPLNGSAPFDVATLQSVPWLLFQDESWLYWTRNRPQAGQYQIVRASK